MTNIVCALNNETNDRDTCLPVSIIDKLHTEHVNDTDENSKETNEKIKDIADTLNCKFDNINNQELCIIKKIGDEKNKLKYFKPVADRLDKDYWINNTEIDNIQYQFSTHFKGYYYSNIHMIDFGMFYPQNSEHIEIHKYIKPIREINWIDEIMAVKNNTNTPDNKEINLNYNGTLKGYGLVINTDFSSGSGIHWFSIYFDFDFKNNKLNIEYFNSSGYPIKNQKFKEYFIDLADDITRITKMKAEFIQITTITHQKSTTSNCGAYSLFYIWSRINDNKLPIEYFAKNKITDDKMEEFRSFLFRKK